ncbi:ER membrane protein complex subunit 7 [Ceratocystis lukuohia]|uniref:ER membrane protein complex subunit 7 n=1 Tax=Ceratocystis lukuohia TaxID=2019550 RepID=A0ABR4MRM5_9PEZI
MRAAYFLTAALASIASAITSEKNDGGSSHLVSNSPISTTLLFTVPASQALANPSTLPPSTHAVLSAPGKRFSAPLSVTNNFIFRNVTPGSYLVDVYCASHGFAPLRVDIDATGQLIGAWETYRGNEWDNKGEVVQGFQTGRLEMRVLGQRGFFVERPKFSVLSLFKNPMILMAMVSLVMFMGMPYLMDNLDPELRAEIEERQKGGLLGSMSGGAGSSNSGNAKGRAIGNGNSEGVSEY